MNEFLYFWRSFFDTKLLWIDSVCISQQHNEDKAAQIPLMAEIYQRASRVLVWLGPPPEDVSKTFALRRIMRVMSVLILSSVVTREDMLERTIADDEMTFKLLGAFLSYEWFELADKLG
ncbi:hypothetical protein T440DRAFT_163460 [Plenodomus tracheiphilus IPT5]|uniref:Heterokaryon incompatibility domain-containing protein n=1 Tax=Plenodomus tracheiphilus IPT5 TaxID=1408161 RepID=A0A6A7BJW7_9PLEO|nr:hypothetical protein T440DRAFT_163460 [Plenodomus tracheiphilus IPT5]